MILWCKSNLLNLDPTLGNQKNHVFPTSAWTFSKRDVFMGNHILAFIPALLKHWDWTGHHEGKHLSKFLDKSTPSWSDTKQGDQIWPFGRRSWSSLVENDTDFISTHTPNCPIVHIVHPKYRATAMSLDLFVNKNLKDIFDWGGP